MKVEIIELEGGIRYRIPTFEGMFEKGYYESAFLTHEEAEALGQELFNKYGKIFWT